MLKATIALAALLEQVSMTDLGLCYEAPPQPDRTSKRQLLDGAPLAYRMPAIDCVSRAVLNWRLYDTVQVPFCVDAAEDAPSRLGKPLIFDSARTAKFTSTASSVLATTGIRPSAALWWSRAPAPQQRRRIWRTTPNMRRPHTQGLTDGRRLNGPAPGLHFQESLQGEQEEQDTVSETHLPDTHRQAQVPLLSGHGTLDCPTDGYMPMISYASPLATACCTVATPSLRLAFWV